jgi:predicted NACHT family NTPase
VAFEETMSFPPSRVELYKEALDALLKKWDSSRRIKRDEVHKNLSVGRKESLLSRVAAETFDKGMFLLRRRHLLILSATSFATFPM